MNLTQQMLRAALEKPNKTFVYPFGCNRKAGFGADCLGLLSKLMACLQLGIGFRFCKISRPQGFITNKGWVDYFEPFCGEVSAPFIERINVNAFPYAKKFPLTKYLAGFWLRSLSEPRAHYFAFDHLGQFEKLGPPIFEDNEDYLSARREIMNLLWVYNSESRDEVQAIKQKLKVPRDYVAICIRRGDKFIEHAYVPIEHYVRMIKCLDCDTDTFFIATDDADVVQEISKKMPRYEFISLTKPHATGYVHSDFKMLPASERRYQTLRFFAQLELMRDAAMFLGSKTTNVSWLTNAFRGGDGVLWVD